MVRQINRDIERSGAEYIDFGQFIDLMCAKLGETDTKEDIEKVSFFIFVKLGETDTKEDIEKVSS